MKCKRCKGTGVKQDYLDKDYENSLPQKPRQIKQCIHCGGVGSIEQREQCEEEENPYGSGSN